MQVHLSADERSALVPDGAEVPQTLMVKGVAITAAQYQCLTNTIEPRLDLVIQNVPRTKRIAGQTPRQRERSPHWFIVDEGGEVTIPGLSEFVAHHRARDAN